MIKLHEGVSSQALALTPMILVKSRKFAALFTLGSVFSLGRCVNLVRERSLDGKTSFCVHSFSFLWGPWAHLRHLFSRERIPFTAVYAGTIVATLYCALAVSGSVSVCWRYMCACVLIQMHSTVLTLLFAVAQMAALVWYVCVVC